MYGIKNGVKMGLETVVLSLVTDVCRHSKAEFTNGTMFVANIDAVEASRVLNTVRGYVRCDVKMSAVGAEFAYDFV